MKKLIILTIVWSGMLFCQQSPHGRLDIACSACHTTDSWKMRPDGTFNHDSTGFRLQGQHASVTCASCHKEYRFDNASPNCSSCHVDIHKSELGSDCGRCHSTTSWLIPDMKERHQDTRFPLYGRHLLVECETCHERASTHEYANTPISCIGCHRTDYQQTTNPNHTSVGFPVDCSLCHTVTAADWNGSFNHNQTAFPLTGAHRSVICSACHLNNRFTRIATDCYSCHSSNFIAVQSPNHVTGGFSHDCTGCHTTNAWSPATFDHNVTSFPLTGAHITLDCQSCHTIGNYSLTYSSCYQCHATQFQQTTNPNHVAANYSHDCSQCHTTSSWDNATFNHNLTNFPLTGAHLSLQCQACHVSNNYTIVYSICYQCHATQYQQTTDPNHVAGNYSHDCSQCHTTTNWDNATFNHSTTNFPLTGAHLSIQCSACHTNNNYTIVYADCYQCHSVNYQQATDPNHVAGNYSHDCSQCHSTSSWDNATFNHATTNFPLTGAHVSIQCSACHINSNYQLTYSTCYPCHQSDYQLPTNPNHVTASLSHDCSTCHTTTAWLPSTFNHDTQFLKINSGAHQGNWTACSDCHPTSADYSQFTCISCHAHTQTEMNSSHSSVTNYLYVSSSCYSCHKGA